VVGTIFNIMRYAINDGPGIRTTVFMKGCPLECWWCHNPEGMNGQPEVAYRVERCILCGDCIEACPHGALHRADTRVERTHDLCAVCGTCADHCLTGARESVGREISVSDLLMEILKDRVFYDESGGGVTFSGGEPLLQAEFLAAILKVCREHGIHTTIETSGYTSPANLALVMDHTELFLYDVKLIDEGLHQRHTGVSNRIILQNLAALVTRQKAVIVRVPVIAGVNDDAASIGAIGAFVAGLGGIREIHLLPFHESAGAKYRSLNKDFHMSGVHRPDAQRIRSAAAQLAACGFSVSIGG
jgi:pyruvate formate lyase activating enzyme